MTTFAYFYIGSRRNGDVFKLAKTLDIDQVITHSKSMPFVAKIDDGAGETSFYQISESDKDAITNWAKQPSLNLLADCDGNEQGSISFEPLFEFFGSPEPDPDVVESQPSMYSSFIFHKDGSVTS